LILLFIILFIRADIKGKNKLPFLVLAISSFVVLAVASAINEQAIETKLTEITQKDEEVQTGSRELSNYDKRRNKFEMDIITSSKWNKNIVDPIESGNIKLASEVLRKAVIREGMSVKAEECLAELTSNPLKYIGVPFLVEGDLESYKLLGNEDQITKILGTQKVELFFKLSAGNAVVYMNNDKNRVLDGIGEVQGIFAGISKTKDKDLFVFVGR
jgi:hypothetical protein